MSRKKLKGFDPGNNNKARRSAYQALQENGRHGVVFDQAPRSSADSNKLTGAMRRFATQMLISKKLDARDREREAATKGHTARQGSTNFMPDYKQALAAQIAASSERAAKKAAKDERRRIAREAAASREGAAASAAASAAEAAESQRAAGVAVSLSKSKEEQRAERAAQAAEEAKRSAAAEKKAAAAAAAAEAAAAASAASSTEFKSIADAAAASGAAPEKVTFSTEMRPGESFRSYQARLVREKAEKMEGKVLAKKLSEKKKRKLAEKEDKKKARKDPNIDPRDLRFQAERDAKDAADAERAAKIRGGKAAAADNEPPAAKRARTGPAKEFAQAETVGFGDIVERPPTLTVVPKSKTLSGSISHDRIIDNLLIMQQGKSKKRGGLQGMDEAEKAEWIAKQRDVLRRQDAAKEAEARALQDLREQSLAAYKASKIKRKAEEADARASGAVDKPYVKKSVLKKQKRNRERLQSFKDNAELDLEAEIEAAGGFDD